MNDFEAPQLKDYEPPRIFNTVTAKSVAYNADIIEYLVQTECVRRVEAKKPPMTVDQANEFRKELITLMTIHGNIEKALAHRS